jgi:SAM-dependent methyltransferase
MIGADMEGLKTRCNLCGSGDIKLLYKKSDFNILECGSCRFIFNDGWNIFSDEIKCETEKILNLDTMQMLFDKEKDLYCERFAKELLEISRFKNIGKILDIGCGYGYFLDLAKKSGWEARGVDCNKSAVEFCRGVLSLEVASGKLDDKKYPEKYFDVVTLFHVLEHIPDFEQTILKIKKIIKPRGLIAIDVPNAGDLRRALLGQDWAMFRKEHLWYFSAPTIRLLLERCGFRILEIRPHGGSEILYALDKIFKTDIKKLPSAFFHYLKFVKDILTGTMSFMGFNEDILIYAEDAGI